MDAVPPGSASVVEPEAAPSERSPRRGSGQETARSAPRPDPPGAGSPPIPAGALDDHPEGPPFSRGAMVVIAVATAVVLATTLVLRFWTRSDLWLDEALTVNIARQPLHQLPSLLRRDGAPPLFYLLLHVWMGWFGQSDLAVRSLPGVLGVITLPLAWLAGRRVGGRTVGWAALLLVATSPFAVRYDTEARMYSLVVLLTVLGVLALDRSLRVPRPGNLVAVAVVTALLLYSHYWSLYLVGTTMLWLAWTAWRGRPTWRRGARASLAAAAVGCLAFVPWVPVFLFQSAHTGTPWATPANFAAMVNAVASFAGGGTSQGRALALIFFALVGLALFGTAVDRRHIDLDLATRPLGRPMAVAVGGTLAAAIVGGFVSNSAFDARYASVVFIPLILLVSIGLTTFRDRRVRTAILAVAVVAGLASSFPNVNTNRTQAGQAARAIAASGRPGDIVAYCPDQLGPAVDRLLPADRYRQTTFPRGTGPVFVNWVDYSKAIRSASPALFAVHLEALAGTGRQIFVVWASGYQAFGLRCEALVETLQGSTAYHAQELIQGDPVRFFQPMWVVRFTPTRP